MCYVIAISIDNPFTNEVIISTVDSQSHMLCHYIDIGRPKIFLNTCVKRQFKQQRHFGVALSICKKGVHQK